MASKKKKKDIGAIPLRDVGFRTAFVEGNSITKLSAIIFGLGNLVHKQIIRGLLLLSVELAYVYYMVTFGFKALINFTTLGVVEQREIYNEAKAIYEYVPGDNSLLFLLFGAVTVFITFGFITFMISSVKSAYVTQKRLELGKPIFTFKDDLRSLKGHNLHKALLTLPMFGVLAFTVIPIIFMILIAFTNYDRDHQPPGNLFTWVGLKNFSAMFKSGGRLAQTFWPVLSWTLIWAVFATVSCYILGMLLAILINRKGTRIKGFWRFVFVISVAMPQFVSLLTMRTMFTTNGPVNILLRHLNIIGAQESIPFWTNATIAKILIICINIWIGVPFTMLTTTGILMNIPADLYEAAKVDGANPVVTFFKITLPYMLFITTPTLITTFVGNINNFNVIFLLSGGGPEKTEYYFAGRTDLLITWLYKLTLTNKDFSTGSVLGIIIFLILASLSLLVYRSTSSYKDEEAFQ